MYTRVQDTVYLIRQAVLRVAAAFFHDHALLKEELGMEDWELELASIGTPVIRMSATSRMDSFMTEDSFKFVEINGESPAGIAYVTELAKIYRDLPVFQWFTQKYPVRFVSPLEHTISGLLRVYHEEFDQARLIGFGIVWVALVIFWIENYLAKRNPVRPVPELGEG